MSRSFSSSFDAMVEVGLMEMSDDYLSESDEVEIQIGTRLHPRNLHFYTNVIPNYNNAEFLSHFRVSDGEGVACWPTHLNLLNTSITKPGLMERNLQAAIGSYFDYGTPGKLPSMALIRDEGTVIDDVLNVPPCTYVTKKWILWNNGDEPWPEECILQFAGGDSMGSQKKIKVPSLAPKNFAEVEVQLESPSMPGMYKSQWRTCTPSGSYFGDTIWVIMAVTASSDDSDLAIQLSHLNTCSENPSHHRPADSNCLLNPFGSQPSGRFGE